MLSLVKAYCHVAKLTSISQQFNNFSQNIFPHDYYKLPIKYYNFIIEYICIKSTDFLGFKAQHKQITK